MTKSAFLLILIWQFFLCFHINAQIFNSQDSLVFDRISEALQVNDPNTEVLIDSLLSNDQRISIQAKALQLKGKWLERTQGLHFGTESLLKSYKLLESNIGPDYYDLYRDAWIDLTYNYLDQGSYVEAEKIGLAGLDFIESNKLESSTYGPSVYRVIGNLYHAIGLYNKSLHFREKAMEAITLYSSERGLRYAYNSSNLALSYRLAQEYEKAEKYALEGYAIMKELLSDDHPSVKLETSNIAGLYYNTNRPEKALQYFEKAVEVYHSTGDTLSINYALALNGLGACLNKLGKTDEAFTYSKKANEIFHEISRYDTEYSLMSDMNLGSTLKFDSTQQEKSVEYYKIGLQRFRDYIIRNIRIKTAEDLVDFDSHIMDQIDRHTKAFYKDDLFNETLSPEFFKIALLRNGIALEREIQMSKLLKSNPEFKAQNEKLIELNDQLNIAYQRNQGQSIIDSIENEILVIEKSFLVSGKIPALDFLNITIDDILSKMDHNTALIEFGSHFDKREDDTIFKKYHASILKHENPQVTLVPLFDEEALSKRLSDQSERRAEYVSALYQTAERGVTVTGDNKSLYELIVEPLLPSLEGITKIYYAPNGLLHRINFSAIADKDENILADLFELHLIGSGRHVLNSSKEESYENTAALFFDLDYGAESSIALSRGAALEKQAWSKLKYTKKEGEEVNEILISNSFKSNAYTLGSGIESAFKSLDKKGKSPRVIHLATHGYFLPKLQNEVGEIEYQNIKNPMMRSGLILSSGNEAWLGEGLREGEDNILTASEIAQMDLSNTELVCLSACETALGDIENNEGVYGLQRAFKMAGAKYILMSLWQVPDRETSVFMTTFYENWLTNKMSIPDAFNKTQIEMRDRFFNPYQWAGFVLME